MFAQMKIFFLCKISICLPKIIWKVLLISEFLKVFKCYQCHFLWCSIKLFNLIIVGVHHESTQPIESIAIGVVLHVKNEFEDFSLVDKVV